MFSTGLTQKVPAKFSDISIFRADGLASAALSWWEARRREIQTCRNSFAPPCTVCKKGYNPDEYVRVVFDNFQVVCNDEESCREISELREAFPSYLKVIETIHK